MFRSTTNTSPGPLNTTGPVGASEGKDDDSDEIQLKDVPTERIHLLLNLSVGLQKIAAVTIPVWIEMVGIEGKARVRLQMTPVAPFVKHAAVTFVGAPKLEISAKPLGKKMVIDAMNLPLMSTYVLHAVEDVIKGFIAPLSYTVDVAGLLGAGDGPQDVYSLGVICFVLHQADDLAAADSNGQSDPFVQASFARAGKPLFTSRIVRKRRDWPCGKRLASCLSLRTRYAITIVCDSPCLTRSLLGGRTAWQGRNLAASPHTQVPSRWRSAQYQSARNANRQAAAHEKG